MGLRERPLWAGYILAFAAPGRHQQPRRFTILEESPMKVGTVSSSLSLRVKSEMFTVFFKKADS